MWVSAKIVRLRRDASSNLSAFAERVMSRSRLRTSVFFLPSKKSLMRVMVRA